uniref:Sortilin-Vps10 domain-containing protein n=1 Tax=Mesocestoides corti TaxID=53468 RepID=A0A5K3FTW3_MESCO
SDLVVRIAQVVSYIPKKNVLLVTSGCKKECFLSTDFGDSWFLISRRHFLSWSAYHETRPMVAIPWTIAPTKF